jgi:hypothetical protein
MWLCPNETLLSKTVSGPDLILLVAGCIDPQRNVMERKGQKLEKCYLYWF